MKLYAVGLLIASTLVGSVHGHGHLVSPRSRNWDAAENGAQSQAGVPPFDYCPDCLNQAKGNQICGFNAYNDYDNFLDSQGNPMEWVSLADYTAGETIDVVSNLGTHHNGHMEMRACPDGDASTNECFDTPGNELIFVEDVKWGMPVDPAYPERGMCWGGQNGGVKDFHMKFKLPDHIVGKQVLLQWKYITANSCAPPGYAAYFADNSHLPDSFWTQNLGSCSPPYPSDGTRSTAWPEQFFNCASVSITAAVPTVSPRPTPTPTTRSPSATPAPVESPVEVPTWGSPGGPGCCSLDYKECVTWCGADQTGCDTCNNDEVVWLQNGAPGGNCGAKNSDCTSNSNGCCPGLTCMDQSAYYSQCQDAATISPRPTPPPTLPPTPGPTDPPVPTTPTDAPTTSPPTEQFTGELFSTAESLSTWDAFMELDSLTLKVSDDPPLYALQAAGGAAGSGNVVTESQAYSLLITSIVLASWDTHKMSSNTDADWDIAVEYFEGYFNGWKSMCLNSNKFSGCQSDGVWCEDQTTGQTGICLPGWKHNGDLSAELGTGSAPDGDEDAIVGMIIALKAFDNKEKPSWYDEVRKWADASCTSFLKYNTVVRPSSSHRLVKLGSCWGGWGSNGNNPSYHSPGSFKVMRDYHIAFPENERDYSVPNFGTGSLEDHWNQLIDTTYEVLAAVQCPAQGMVPNWATVDIINGQIEHSNGEFSGSGTPQWEYGSEAARTTWRVAIDAALYPSELQDAAEPYLNPLLNQLRYGYNPDLSFNEKYFDADTFTTCEIPGNNNGIFSFSGGWIYNAFIFAPTVSALVVPIDGVSKPEQQTMVDAAGSVLSSNIPSDYYARCWTILGILTLNGSIESAGNKLAYDTPDIQTTGIPCCSNNLKHCVDWECNGCHESKEKCLSAQSSFFWMPWGEVVDDESCIAITYSCAGHNNVCCPGMICNPTYALGKGPCIVSASAPTDVPTTSPSFSPTIEPNSQRPVTLTAAPVVTPAPITRAPITTPAPAAPTPAPFPPTSHPITPTPSPVTLTPAPFSPTSAPITPTPSPVTLTLAPVAPIPTTPAPVAPTPGITTSNGIPLPCCSWNGNECEQPNNDWCHAQENQCTGACNGQWKTGKVDPAPSPAPVAAPTAGCCTWGGWSTCPDWTTNSSDACQQTVTGCQNCSGTWISS